MRRRQRPVLPEYTGGFVEQAKGFEMDAIASSVIGGTLLTGGVGNVVGTYLAS